MDSDTKFILTLLCIVFLVIFAVTAWFSMILAFLLGILVGFVLMTIIVLHCDY